MEARAAVTLPFTASGRCGMHEKFVAEVTSNGFSKVKVNWSSRYGAFAAAAVAGFMSATNVIRRVFLAIRLWRVGQIWIAAVVCGGV